MTASTKHINFEAESIGSSKAFNTSKAGIAHLPIDQASQLGAPAVQASEMLALDVHSGESTSQLYASYFAASTTLQQTQQQQQQFLPGAEKEKRRNTDSEPRVVTKIMFGSLSRLAGDAFKGAKQATEQLAQVAQHAASTSDLTMTNKSKLPQMISSSYPISPSQSFLESDLLPGLDDLSEEERQKIMAVMASAELDMASTSVSGSSAPVKISVSLDSFFKNEDPRNSISSLPEQSKVDSVSTNKVESKSSVTMPLFSDIVNEIDLSCLSPAEQNHIIGVMKAAESEEANIIPPVSSLLPVSTTAPLSITPINDEFHDNLAGLSQAERDQILTVLKAAEEEHFEITQPVFQNGTLGDHNEDNKWRQDKNFESTGDQDMENHEAFMESSAISSIGATLPQIDSDYTIAEDSSCDLGFRHPSLVSSIATGTDIQETDTPSAPGSSDYGSADFDYTYGDDRRFIFDGTSQLEDSPKENQDTDSGIGALDWSDQGHYEWSERKPRMWTTVFTEEEEKHDTDMQKRGKMAENYIQAADSHHQIIAVTDAPENTAKESSDTVEKNVYKINTTQDNDERLFTSTDNLPEKALESQTSAAQHEILKTAHIMRIPPAITVTDHDHRIRLTADDDSDAETSPSSDEDDYPDQVIEVPSAPPISYDEVEKEQEQQEAFGKAVLQQIQAFGEAANDEFDVQWVHDNLIRNEAISNIFSHDESTTPAVAYDGILLSVETEHNDKAASLNKVTSERKNPFLDVDGSVDDSILKIVEEDSLEPDDVDYTAAANYYSSQSLLTHRPGSVYTIPEDKEQDDGQVNTDSKFYAKEVIRRIRAESAVLQATSKSTAFSEGETALNMFSTLNPTQKGRDVTTTVYSSDYYSQLQKRQAESSKQTLFHDEETNAVTPVVEANMNSFEASKQLEHITTSSPTAQKEPSSCLSSGGVSLCSSAMVFNVSSHRIASAGFDGIQNGRIDEMEISTNLPASKNDSGIGVLKMNSGIIQHSKSESSSNLICSMSNFHQIPGQPCNSPSKAKPASLSETLGSGLDSNAGTISSRFDADPTATRLKRSPAMMLMGGQQHHVPSTSATSEMLATAYAPTLFSQTIPKEVI
ncbi:unnamed protein product [Cercopithifilaria johnstoni]|uniref:Uncharacterized protein n=1 Tax=Cercopithifilaria johnstoni TaxID=2874296 RepID=A0A8J2M942_9BILA|nr:unnamed protein product [Cercopithifilaria johnstoni]